MECEICGTFLPFGKSKICSDCLGDCLDDSDEDYCLEYDLD